VDKLNNKYKALIKYFESQFKGLQGKLVKHSSKIKDLLQDREEFYEDKKKKLHKNSEMDAKLSKEESKHNHLIGAESHTLVSILCEAVTFFNLTGRQTWKEESLILFQFNDYLKSTLTSFQARLQNQISDCETIKEITNNMDISADIKNSFSELIQKYQIGDSYFDKIILKVLKSSNFEEDKIYYSMMFANDNDNFFKSEFNLEEGKNQNQLTMRDMQMGQSHIGNINQSNEEEMGLNSIGTPRKANFTSKDANYEQDNNDQNAKEQLLMNIKELNFSNTGTNIQINNNDLNNSLNPYNINPSNMLGKVEAEKHNKSRNVKTLDDISKLNSNNQGNNSQLPLMDKSNNEINNIVNTMEEGLENNSPDFTEEWSSDDDLEVEFMPNDHVPVFDKKKAGIKDKEIKNYIDKLQGGKSLNRASTLKNEDLDYLDYFSCAYADSILLQGNLKIYKNKLTFKSYFNNRTFLGSTKLIVPFSDIMSLQKKSNVGFDNSIEIHAKQKKLFFTSFVFRDRCFKKISDLLSAYKNDNPNNDAVGESGLEDKDTLSKTRLSVSLPTEKLTKQAINEMLHDNFKKLKIKERMENLTKIRLNKYNALKERTFMEEKWYTVNIMDKQPIANAPLSVVYNACFNPQIVSYYFDSNKNFWESLLISREDKNYECIQKNDPSKVPQYFKDISCGYNLFAHLSSSELDKFYKEAEDWELEDVLGYKYYHFIGKKIVGPSSVWLNEYQHVNFISPTMLIVEFRTFGQDFIYSDCFASYLQYIFTSDFEFDEKKGKVVFKTYMKIMFHTTFLKSCMFSSIISKEGAKDSTETTRYQVSPKVTGAIEQLNSESNQYFEKISEDAKRKRIKKLKMKEIKNGSSQKNESIENVEQQKEDKEEKQEELVKETKESKELNSGDSKFSNWTKHFQVGTILKIVMLFLLALLLIFINARVDVLELLLSDKFYKVFSMGIILALSYKVYNK